MILSAHISGIAKCVFSLFGIVINLNSKESNRINYSARASVLHLACLLCGSMFGTKYLYKSLKNGKVKWPACISLIVRGKCVPFSTFLLIMSRNLSISACCGRYFCTTFKVFTSFVSSWGYSR